MIGNQRTAALDGLARIRKSAQASRVMSRRLKRIAWAWIVSAALVKLQAAPDTNVIPPSPTVPHLPSALSPLDRLAAAFSPRFRGLVAERNELEKQLAGAPRPNSAPTSEASGFHSVLNTSTAVTKWVQVDLGSERSMDAIALVPAHVAVGEYSGQGYGFPRRFRVELADDDSFALSRAVADFTQEDFPNPGDQPLLIEVAGERARYVRVTATKLWQRGNAAVLALGELIVMSGDRNRSEEHGRNGVHRSLRTEIHLHPLGHCGGGVQHRMKTGRLAGRRAVRTRSTGELLLQFAAFRHQATEARAERRRQAIQR